MTTSGPLSDSALGKAERYMRALRRAILSYWYATIEDGQAALIEAVNACLVANILDESVFAVELGDAYKRRRRELPNGRVVTGFELVRNCETHSLVVVDDLLVLKRQHSIPLQGEKSVMRSVWHWAKYDDLPRNYVELPTTIAPAGLDVDDAQSRKMRARKEAQHGYCEGVQGRSVIETLFDAECFFVELEPRLSDVPDSTLEYPYAEVPQGDGTILHRPLEYFTGTVLLPDLLTQWYERISMSAPPADRYVADLASSKNRDAPTGDRRLISHKISAEGKTIAYSGCIETSPGRFSGWVERNARIGRDIRKGFPYFVRFAGGDVPVASSENLVLTAAIEGRDLLVELPEAEKERGMEWLLRVEKYPDLYLSMRNGL